MINTKRIKVVSSTSPLGGGSVRVYVADSLVYRKDVTSLGMMLKAEYEIKQKLNKLANQADRRLRLV